MRRLLRIGFIVLFAALAAVELSVLAVAFRHGESVGDVSAELLDRIGEIWENEGENEGEIIVILDHGR